MGQEKYDDLMQIDNIVGFEDLQICENNMGSGTFPVLTADSTQDDDSSDYAILSGVVDYKDSIIDFKDYGVAVYNDSGYLEDENHVALSNSTLIAVNLLVGYDAKVIVRDSSLLEINQTSSNKGAILIGGGCQFYSGANIINSGSISVEMGGVIGFGDSLVVSSDAKKIVLSGFTEIVSSPVLVIDYTGTAAQKTFTIDTYETVVAGVDKERFRVVNNDLYYFGSGDFYAYVSTEYSEDGYNDGHIWGVDAFDKFTTAQDSVLDKSIIIKGVRGSFTSTSVMRGYTTVLDDGTYSFIIGGYKVAADKERSWVDDIEEGTNLTINGGTFKSNVIGGTYIGRGSVYQEGNLNLTINGGTFEKAVAAGMYYDSRSLLDTATLCGNINLTITGGTFKSFVYGGNTCQGLSQYSIKTTVQGDIHVLIDTSVNEIEFVGQKASLVAGSAICGPVSGSTTVTLTGVADNLHFNGNSLSGGCSGDGYVSRVQVQSWVLGDRSLVMNNFNGDFDARLVMFNKLSMTDSTVNLSYNAGRGSVLFDVATWDMEESTLSGCLGFNDFTGDTLNLIYKDGGTVFDAESDKGIDNWQSFGLVTINGVEAEFNGVDAYCTSDFKFGLDQEDNTRLIVTKIS